MKTLMMAGLAGALTLGTVGMAWAGAMPQTETQSYSKTTNWTSTLSFAGASVPAGYHLSSVTLDVSESLNGVVTVSNALKASSSATGSVSQQDTLTFTIPGMTQDSLTNLAPFQTVDVAPGSSTPFSFSNVATQSYTLNSGLTPFLTPWMLPVSDIDRTVTALSGGTTNVGNTNTGGVSVTATYDFAANATGVAEPFSVAMLASGLLSLALVRRRRRS